MRWKTNVFSYSSDRAIHRGDETTESFCSVTTNRMACGWFLTRSRRPGWESDWGWRRLHELIEFVVGKMQDGSRATKTVELMSPR